MMFLKQAQSIWEKMGLASMGIAMPQSYAEAENVVKAVQHVQQTQQKQADSAAARSQPLYGSAAGTGQFQAAAMRAAPAGYGQGFTYAPPQGSQAQMNPLLPDFAGLQYPGY